MNPINSLTKQFKHYLHWHKSHLDVLSILIVAIIKRRTVNWAELATTFPGVAATPSCYRRIQRFFKDVAFEEETIAQLIAHLFPGRGLDAQHGSYQLDVWQVQNQHPIPCHQLQRHGYPYTLDATAQKRVLKHSGENRSVGALSKNLSGAACAEAVGG